MIFGHNIHVSLLSLHIYIWAKYVCACENQEKYTKITRIPVIALPTGYVPLFRPQDFCTLHFHGLQLPQQRALPRHFLSCRLDWDGLLHQGHLETKNEQSGHEWPIVSLISKDPTDEQNITESSWKTCLFGPETLQSAWLPITNGIKSGYKSRFIQFQLTVVAATRGQSVSFKSVLELCLVPLVNFSRVRMAANYNRIEIHRTWISDSYSMW